MVSIQKPHTDNIFNHSKGVEWRTKPMPTGIHYCYETKNGGGIGKVIGEFTVYRVKKYDAVHFIPNDIVTAGKVSRPFLNAYSKGKPLYAHFIKKPKKYRLAKPLSDFRKAEMPTGLRYEKDIITRPPQSWCRVEKVDF